MPTNPTPTFESLTLSGGTVTGVTNAVNPTDVVPFQQTFVASGASAAAGLVPSPGTTAGTTRFLREDATWELVPVTSTTFTFTPQTAPTLAAGITWGDSTQNALQTYIDGAKGWVPTVLMVSNAVDSISIAANTTTNILSSSYIGTPVLPANFLVPGKTLRITVRGYVTTAPTSTSVVSPNLVLGTIGFGNGNNGTGFDTTSTCFSLEYTLTCITSGTTGTCMSHLYAMSDGSQSALGQTVSMWGDNNKGSVTTVNTTTQYEVYVQLYCSVALSIAVTFSMIEVIA